MTVDLYLPPTITAMRMSQKELDDLSTCIGKKRTSEPPTKGVRRCGEPAQETDHEPRVSRPDTTLKQREVSTPSSGSYLARLLRKRGYIANLHNGPIPKLQMLTHPGPHINKRQEGSSTHPP